MRILKTLSVVVLAVVSLIGNTTFAREPITTNDTYTASNNAVLSVVAPGVLSNDFDSNNNPLSVAPLVSQTFTFDGITFDQALTPNRYKSLAPGTYNGAIITAAPTSVAGSVGGFPDSITDFYASLSIGRQFEDSTGTTTTKALNLPASNDGTAARSGFEMRWAAGVMLTNLSGDDFVVFEAGSNGAPEAYMVQVHNPVGDVWSSWIYITPQSYANYNGRSDGLHSTKFNLDSFGVAENDAIDAIRIVNITDEDRMADISGVGVVLPEDNASTSTVLPKAPGGGTYANGSLDPDIVYVGSLHTLQSTIPAYAATSELGATVVVNSDGSFTYDPSTSVSLLGLSPGQSTQDSFYYLAADGFSGNSVGSVTITVSAELPSLSIEQSGLNVIVSWPTSEGFVLQSTDSLSDPVWVDVDIEPTQDSGTSSVTINATEGNLFFRLVSIPPG